MVDSNEGAPFLFSGLKDDAGATWLIDLERKPLWSLYQRPIRNSKGVIETVGLADYAILGHEQHIGIERKSLSDLFTTLGSRRDRFECEIARLNDDHDFAAVVVEANVLAIKGWQGPGPHPNSVLGTIKSWRQRYPRVHWKLENSREDAQIRTFEILWNWWCDFERGKLVRQFNK